MVNGYTFHLFATNQARTRFLNKFPFLTSSSLLSVNINCVRFLSKTHHHTRLLVNKYKTRFSNIRQRIAKDGQYPMNSPRLLFSNNFGCEILTYSVITSLSVTPKNSNAANKDLMNFTMLTDSLFLTTVHVSKAHIEDTESSLLWYSDLWETIFCSPMIVALQQESP
jgi:hypothetical protein